MTAILIAVVVVGAIYLVARNQPTPRTRKPGQVDGGSDAGATGSEFGGGYGDCGGDGGGGCD